MPNSKTFVFLEGKPFSGTSKKTGNEFTIRNLKFADTNTFENHILEFDEKLDHVLTEFSKGDKFTFDYILQPPMFGNGVSRMVVTAIKKVG